MVQAIVVIPGRRVTRWHKHRMVRLPSATFWDFTARCARCGMHELHVALRVS